MFRAGSSWLERHIHVVNGLNVFPAPDGDTGTNMLLTMRAALQGLEGAPDHAAGTVAAAAAQGALRGARGNSGVILSQVLQGLAAGLEGKMTFSGADWTQAVRQGVAQAYESVSQPVEGTILTVARAAAEATPAGEAETVEDCLARMVTAARSAQARTPELLPILKEAGVTDAGGQGFLYILEGALQGLTLGELEPPAEVAPALRPNLALSEEAYGYDVQFLLQGQGLQAGAIRARLNELGWSVLVVGEGELLRVHLHTAEPERALAYSRSLGSLSDVVVEDMGEQARAFLRPAGETGEGETAVLAVVPGRGLADIFESLGAAVILSSGPELSLEAFQVTLAEFDHSNVLLLPNHEAVLAAAQSLAWPWLRLVPTRTIPQGIAAMLAFDRQAPLDHNLRRITQVMGRVVSLELKRAGETDSFQGWAVQVGDAPGLCHNDLYTVGPTAREAVLAALARLDMGLYELLTLYSGQALSPEEVGTLSQVIGATYPSLQVEHYEGGQPGAHYIISLE